MASPSALPASLSSERLRDVLCWRGDELAPVAATFSSGFGVLDKHLPGGGWPTHSLTELLLPADGIGEIRLLSPALKRLADEDRAIVLIAPPHAPLLAGWTSLGIASPRILLIEPPRPADWSWTVEQALKSGAFGALIVWLPPHLDHANREDRLADNSGLRPPLRRDLRHGIRHEALRRMQLAATSAGGLSFLVRPVEAQHDASPAPLRLLLEAGATTDRGSLSVRILKRRGPVLPRSLTLDLPEIRRLRPRRPGVHVTFPEDRRAVVREMVPEDAGEILQEPRAFR